ncbi:MAG: hypothetical protein KatS3mg028_0415 [Bacteroidia bacterium]|nr:MAG: hypothetical protein KatS3mg028_0415 [Bacteroidia bacterium]
MLHFIRHNLQKKFFSNYYHGKFKYSEAEKNKFFAHHDNQILFDLLKNKFNSDHYRQKFSTNEQDTASFFQQLDEHQLKNTLSGKFSSPQYLNKFQYTESEWLNFQKYLHNKNKKIAIYLLSLLIPTLLFTTLWIIFEHTNRHATNTHHKNLPQKNTFASKSANNSSSIHTIISSASSITSQKNSPQNFSHNHSSLNKKENTIKQKTSPNKKYLSTHHHNNNTNNSLSVLTQTNTSKHLPLLKNDYNTTHHHTAANENSGKYQSLNPLLITHSYSLNDSVYLLPVQNQPSLPKHLFEKNNFISLYLSCNVYLTSNRHTGYAPYAGIMYQHHFENMPFAVKSGIAYLYIPLKNSSMYVTQTKHYDFSYRTDDIYLIYQSLHYIRLPLYLNYQSSLINLSAGLNFNFLLTGKAYAQILHSTSQTSYIEKDKIYNFSDGLQNYNYSLHIGLSKNITRRLSLCMEYETFLSPLTTKEYTFNYSLNSTKIFRIGLEYKIFKL